MKTLTRRTALAAVPALAATPLLASGVSSPSTPLTVTPRINTLAEEYCRAGVEGEQASDELGRLIDAIRARGIVRPEGPPPGYLKTKAAVDASGYSESERREGDEWQRRIDEYGALYQAQPEIPRMDALDKTCNECLDRKWAIVDEIVEIPATTLGDLKAQIEVLLEHSVELNLDGTISQIAIDTQAEQFMLRLPSEIARLAGAS